MFAETISNPAGVILDIEKFVKLAHDHGVPMICDNTFATPINCRPFAWGVDIVTHSTTKYMDGHAMAVGGAIVDSGNFDWMAHKDKFPGLTTPDESYHGIVYAEKFGKAAYITKATAQLMRDMGACQSPQNAFLTNIGLETLHLRVPKHCENATKVAAFLKNHPKVAWVEYAGLPGDKYYDLAQKYMPKGVCGVLCFGPKGGRDGALRFTNALKMVAIETHVADAKSCVLHPASHTHRPAQRRAAGGSRRTAGSDPPFCGHRGCRRHHRGSGSGSAGSVRKRIQNPASADGRDPSSAGAWRLPEFAERRNNMKLEDIFREKKAEALLITDPYNMRYISGFRGGEGMLFLTLDRRVLITDSRYTEAAVTGNRL